jgi:heme O synthase-like polyprenyltransferase
MKYIVITIAALLGLMIGGTEGLIYGLGIGFLIVLVLGMVIAVGASLLLNSYQDQERNHED